MKTAEVATFTGELAKTTDPVHWAVLALATTPCKTCGNPIANRPYCAMWTFDTTGPLDFTIVVPSHRIDLHHVECIDPCEGK